MRESSKFVERGEVLWLLIPYSALQAASANQESAFVPTVADLHVTANAPISNLTIITAGPVEITYVLKFPLIAFQILSDPYLHGCASSAMGEPVAPGLV
jgi:hypothetical protein